MVDSCAADPSSLVIFLAKRLRSANYYSAELFKGNRLSKINQ